MTLRLAVFLNVLDKRSYRPLLSFGRSRDGLRQTAGKRNNPNLGFARNSIGTSRALEIVESGTGSVCTGLLYGFSDSRRSYADSLFDFCVTGSSGSLQKDLCTLLMAHLSRSEGNNLLQILPIFGRKLRGLEDFKEVTSVSFVQWRNEVNHLTRRMGDLRSSESGVGAWARVHGGESKVKDSSVEFDTTSVQVGADALVEDWIVGSALSYNDSSIDLVNGDGDGESWSLAVYASRFFDSGAFIDLTGRYGYLKNEFTSKDMGVKTDNHAFALSAEVGHRFEVAKNAYVEPQVELAYGFIKGDNVTASNGVRVEQDDAQTLTGRVGLRFGADCPNDRGTVYGLVSYNYEFLGDIESRASLGDKSARMERSLDGGWFSYGIGAQANISKTWSGYGELERTSGGDVENPWRWSVGVRHVF